MDYILDTIKKELSAYMETGVIERLSVPPGHIDADLAIPLESPNRAEELQEKLKQKQFTYIKSFTTANNFLNIVLKQERAYHDALRNILESGLGYGASNVNSGKKAFIEYSSPNIAKPIGVGHLRSTIIGEALARIYESTGFEVWRENYLGDWGTPFGKVLVAYQKWGDEETLANNPLESLKDLYVRFQEEAKNDESLMEEARDAFKKLEEGDEEVVEMWENFRRISMEEFKTVYSQLGIEFDNYSGESNAAEDAKEEVENCLSKGVCKEGEKGAIVVEDLDNLPSFLLRKEDGSTLYAARDLAELKNRINMHNPDEIMYVVGSEQEMYFRQLFALADAMGYLKETIAQHISFGLVMVDDKPMSTREGTLIELDELLNKAMTKARSIIDEKNPDLDKQTKETVAREVGIGSIIYNDLGQQRSKNISFDWDTMLDFNAGSGPYLQYTYARIQSILRNLLGEDEDFHNLLISKSQDFTLTLADSVEFDVLKDLILFPNTIINTAHNQAPHIICTYLEKLASDFNTFYNTVSIKDTEEEDLQLSRLILAFAVSIVIKKGLFLLNIQVPEKM